jgi:hypothetical protein
MDVYRNITIAYFENKKCRKYVLFENKEFLPPEADAEENL